MLWHFKTYVSPSGRNDIQKEIDRYNAKEATGFDRRVRHLAICPKSEWNEPHALKLTAEDPIYEIRYKANQRSTRALGYFDDATRAFTIVIICYHKQDIYTPHGAFVTAHNRIKDIAKGIATTADLQIFGETLSEDA